MTSQTTTPLVRLSTGREVPLPPRAQARFYSKRTPTPHCIEWAGALDRDGYGRFTVKDEGRTTVLSAHRVAFVLGTGTQVPVGLEIDHTCDNRKCVTPEHLAAVTSQHNTLRSQTNPTAMNKRKTHCKHGHRFDDENTYVTPSGYRRCRKCHARRVARYRNSHRQDALYTP